MVLAFAGDSTMTSLPRGARVDVLRALVDRFVAVDLGFDVRLPLPVEDAVAIEKRYLPMERRMATAIDHDAGANGRRPSHESGVILERHS